MFEFVVWAFDKVFLSQIYCDGYKLIARRSNERKKERKEGDWHGFCGAVR